MYVADMSIVHNMRAVVVLRFTSTSSVVCLVQISCLVAGWYLSVVAPGHSMLLPIDLFAGVWCHYLLVLLDAL